MAHRITEQDDIRETFARNLRRLMYADEISQKDLAEKMNVAPSTVSAWCAGNKLPRIETIQQLADIFDVDRSDLISNAKMDIRQNQQQQETRTPVPTGTITMEDIALAQKINKADEQTKRLIAYLLEFEKAQKNAPV